MGSSELDTLKQWAGKAGNSHTFPQCMDQRGSHSCNVIWSDNSTNEVSKAITFYTQADKQSSALSLGSRQSRKGDTERNVMLKCQVWTLSFFLKTITKTALDKEWNQHCVRIIVMSNISLFTEISMGINLYKAENIIAELTWIGNVKKLKLKSHLFGKTFIIYWWELITTKYFHILCNIS